MNRKERQVTTRCLGEDKLSFSKDYYRVQNLLLRPVDDGIVYTTCSVFIPPMYYPIVDRIK